MPDGSNPNPGEGDPGTNTPENTTANRPEMPDGLPESFWDAEAGQVKTDDLIKSYSELNTFKSEYDSRFANRPESPDAYEIRLPEDIELSDEQKAQFDLSELKDNPLMKSVLKIVHDAGGDQSTLDALMGEVIKDEMAYQQAATAEVEKHAKEEKAKLGQNADARIEAINAFLTGNLSEEQVEALSAVGTSAAAIEALETLISKISDAAPKGGGEPGGVITQAQLTEMQNDPRYWRDKDPAFIKQVEAGYAKLFPGTQQRIT